MHPLLTYIHIYLRTSYTCMRMKYRQADTQTDSQRHRDGHTHRLRPWKCSDQSPPTLWIINFIIRGLLITSSVSRGHHLIISTPFHPTSSRAHRVTTPLHPLGAGTTGARRGSPPMPFPAWSTKRCPCIWPPAGRPRVTVWHRCLCCDCIIPPSPVVHYFNLVARLSFKKTLLVLRRKQSHRHFTSLLLLLLHLFLRLRFFLLHLHLFFLLFFLLLLSTYSSSPSSSSSSFSSSSSCSSSSCSSSSLSSFSSDAICHQDQRPTVT